MYKGYLVGQYIDEVVAIKTLKGLESDFGLYQLGSNKCLHLLCRYMHDVIGFIDKMAVQELLSEYVKMKNLNHLHIMTLKGICLDGGPVPYIVLPYMANGSSLSYLKKERKNLTISRANDSNSEEEEEQSQVSFNCL